MKKFLVKIRNKRLKGNISLLVIIILLASSVISLLSINQIQRLITYWNQTFYYFRAFYLAKAWTELWLTEVYHSGDWFNDMINSSDAIVTWNLLPEFVGFNPYFKVTITWSFYTLNDDIRNPGCSGDNKIKLAPWAGIMLSLFSDDTEGLDKILSDESGDKNPKKLDNIGWLRMEENSSNTDFTFAFFTYKDDDEMSDIVVDKWLNLSEFLDKSNVEALINDSHIIKKYLTIKNSWTNEAEFCIIKTDEQKIPYSDSLITVFWHYGDMEVWIQSVVKKWVPDWTLNVLDNVNSSS